MEQADSHLQFGVVFFNVYPFLAWCDLTSCSNYCQYESPQAIELLL
jgi:hypothetical protein